MHRIPPNILARHSRLIPNYITPSVAEIDFEALAEVGLKNVFIDVDNTLASYGENNLAPRTVAVINAARLAGFIDTLTLASNTRRNLDVIVQQLSPTLVVQSSGLRVKPRRGFFDYALNATGSQSSTSVMIGDKLIQDIWGARRAGMTTVLVKPLGQDFILDRIFSLRAQERWLLARSLPRHPEHWF
jgi:HAD superfamily phosphatase (TIGR01668 family)